MFVEPFLKLMDAGIIKREVEGALLHAAFFVGPKSFYRALREMPQEALNRIQMKAVSFTNEILDDIDAKRLRAHRRPLRQQRDDGDVAGRCRV